MDSTFLKYGDVINLYSESGPGYLQSQGFTNPGCYIQYQPKETRQACRNYRDFCYKILPKLTYDARKEYHDLRKHKEKNANNKDALINIEQKLMIYKKKVKDEEEINKKVCQMKEGEWVTYGNEIQLMHCDSLGFVTANKLCADFDRSCNKIEITEKGSYSAIFRVLPRYKFRQEGENVLYRDQIVFLNIKTNLYLHITENWIEKTTPIKPPREDWRPLDADRRDDPAEFVKRFEVNCSTSSSRFQAVPMTQISEDPNNKLIKGNQVIRLQHTELGGYLTSDDLDFTGDELAEIYVKCYNGDPKDIEAVSSGDLFELEIATNYDRGKVCMWTDPKDVANSFQYRLRHLNSGRVVRTQEVKITDDFTSLGLADHPVEGKEEEDSDISLMSLISTTVDTDNRIRAGTSLKIQSIKDGKFLSTKYDKEWTGGVQGGGERTNSKGGFRPTKKDSFSELIGEVENINNTIEYQGIRNKGKKTGIYNPLDDEELYNCRNLVVELLKNASNEDTFMIIPVDENEIRDLLFIQTVSSQLFNYTRYLRAKKIDEITKAYNAKIIELLTKLIFFIVDTEGSDPITCTGDPIKPRQKLMRELRVIELLVDCLYYPFKDNKDLISSLTDDMPLKKISILCYRLILHSVKDYRLNELYASQWIELYFEQSLASIEVNIKAENTIAVLISNNRVLLEKQITTNTIDKFISL